MADLRTYVPGLRLALKALILYITRYKTKLQTNISPTAYTCLLATLNAADECLAALPPQNIEPDA